MRAWLRHAAAAAVLAGEHPAWWLPGALGFFVYLGWVPLAVTVVPAPNAGDLAYLGVQLISSPSFPWNVVALAVALAGTVLLACVLAAFTEMLLVRMVRRDRARSGTSLAGLGAIIVAALPAAAVAVVMAQRVSALAPDRFLSSASLGEIAAGLLDELWPLVLLLVLAVVVGQAVGAVAMRTEQGGRTARDLARHPLRRLATAGVGMITDLAVIAVTLATLRVLWAPIGADLGAGRFLRPGTLALLLGFVAIWLALLLAAGAARTWLSAWWSLEVDGEP